MSGDGSAGSLDSSATSIHSPLPPSASKAALSEGGAGTSMFSEPSGGTGHRSVLRVLENEREVSRRRFEPSRSSSSRPVAPAAQTTWSAATFHALPIALMNVALAHVYAHLICIGTVLEPAYVAAMHIFGMVVAQCVLLVTSGVARFAIASPDVTVALLSRAAVVQICARAASCRRSPRRSPHGARGARALVPSLAPRSLPARCLSGALALWRTFLPRLLNRLRPGRPSARAARVVADVRLTADYC